MIGASAVAILSMLGAGVAYAQDSEQIETVTVTGFRASLEKALDMKRSSLDASDTIMAEDIAKFPDLNVSESLQRIPGVALARDAGEGREISVRGLGAIFTRVRVNGIEAMSSTGSADSSGGANVGRSFDFNVFGSELFSGLTVHKSASADLEEGSLGATVDMRTARPFDYGKFVFAASGSLGYNELAQSVNPRGSVLVSNTFLGGRLGALFSVSYNVRHIIEDGSSSVRWSVVDSGSSVFRPRMPRYEIYRDSSKRLGLSGALQWQADDDTLFTLTGLFADYAATRNESQLELSSYGTVTASSGYVSGTNYVQTYLKSNGASIRTENRYDILDTRFSEVTLEGTHDFSDKLKVGFEAGWTESHHRNPMVMLSYDLKNVQGYSYDFSENKKMPLLTYGDANLTGSGSVTCASGVTSCNAWYLSQFRIRPIQVYNSARSIQSDFEYSPYQWLKVSGGMNYKNYGFLRIENRLSDGTGANWETVQNGYGTYAASATNFYGSATDATSTLYKVLHTPVSSYSTIVSMPSRGLNLPSGSVTSWLAPDLSKADAIFDYSGFKMDEDAIRGDNMSVRENDFGGWLQMGWDTLFYGIPFRGNVGGRLVETETTSAGWNIEDGQYVFQTVDTNYHDFLPSFNAVFEPTENFLIRINASQVMARPDLGSLAGTYVSVSGSSYTVNIGNPGLKPYRASTVDLSYEWYYHKGAMLSVALFYKKIGTYVQSFTSTQAGNKSFVPTYGGVTLAADQLDDVLDAACGSTSGCSHTASWTFSESINTPGGILEGIELNWQQPFDFLPHPLDNFGFSGNVTFVESSILNGTSSGSTKSQLVGQSRNSYNATLYYDDTVFQTRVSAAYRGKYLTRNPGKYTNIEGMGATFNLDASASYKFEDGLMITLDALNLTNQFQYQYTDSTSEMMYVNHQTGREVYLGIKYNY
jgi:iron complex outermembrane recepter protein